MGSSSVPPMMSKYTSPLRLSPELVARMYTACVSRVKCVSVPVSVNSPWGVTERGMVYTEMMCAAYAGLCLLPINIHFHLLNVCR